MESGPPLFSTFTLITEIFITVAILYIFYSGYKQNKFPKKLTFFTLFYEIFFNISYMTHRALFPTASANAKSPAYIAIAAFHGIFSLTMFIALVVFLILAMKNYNKGKNYFKEHKIISGIFLMLWFIAIFSGIIFYFVRYFQLL